MKQTQAVDGVGTAGARSRRPWTLVGREVPLGLVVLLVTSVVLAGLAGIAGPTTAEEAKDPIPLPRWVSLNPSLTAIVVRLGARDALVGIDDYSARVLPELADLPQVGGLFDPSLEAVVALRPDRVLVVAGVDQASHAARLEALGLEVDIYPNERLEEVLENIDRLGRLLGRSEAAKRRIDAINEMRAAVSGATADLERPATVAIVDRSPLYLVGAETFLDEMLEAVGAENLVRALPPGYPRGSVEWLIAAKPTLLLDMTPGAEEAARFWSRWPSLPAVAQGRVVTVEASRVSLPGPDLDRALLELAEVVHGADIAGAIDARLRAADANEVSPRGVAAGGASR